MTPSEILHLRTRPLTSHDVAPDREYVLCWLMQALRADYNPIVDRAILLGNELGLPVVVLHALENTYPYASHRLHRFILEASLELEEGIKRRKLRFVRWVRRGGEGEVDVVAQLGERAAAVVVDDVPTFVTRSYADALAGRFSGAVLAVDACCAVPMNAFPDHLDTTKKFRAAHTKLRDLHLGTDLHQDPEIAAYTGTFDLGANAGANLAVDTLDDCIAECGVDLSVRAVDSFPGRRSAALQRMTEAIKTVLPRYRWTRNNPALADDSTHLSPYLHFGVLSPREVALEVLRSEREEGLHSAARWKFFDEMLTWREYYHHRCRHVPDFTRWAGLPEWARESMLDHADDPRPHQYDLAALIHGKTDDETWNAAQLQFTAEGWMNNNLRMYWVKQIIKWRPDPREAFAAACYLNDRFSLDGRDASTYGGIRWGFGEARRGYREINIYGWVAPKSDTALRKRAGVKEWLSEQASRKIESVDVPPDWNEIMTRYVGK